MNNNQPRQNREVVVILPNIRSVINVGSIFRTADACGVSKIYLCGYTPAPVDRFGRERNDIHKAALGAEKTVKWEHLPKTEEVIGKLRNEGFTIYAVEQDQESVVFNDIEYDKKSAFIFGNEVEGVDKEILDLVDHIIEIPMFGKKESLNVSVSAGIVLYQARLS